MIPTDWEKMTLAAALADNGKRDYLDLCPKCGESDRIHNNRCTQCGKELFDWYKNGVKLYCYCEEVGHE